MIRKVFIGLFLGMLCVSCTWENEEVLYSNTIENCNINVVTYSNDVVPLLDFNCNGCHSHQSASALGDNIVLDDYTLLINYVKNDRLMGSVMHSKGYNPMPKSGPKLTICEIETLQKWIDNGALNN
ncbi:MAG: hypothetical protein ACFHWX_08450 [Bacteroidota bacterium]